MIVQSSSNSHLELGVSDDLELLRLAQLMKVDPTGICKALVIFVREPLDSEELHTRFYSRLQEARAANAELDAQLDFTQP